MPLKVQELLQKDYNSQILGRMLQNSIFWKRDHYTQTQVSVIVHTRPALDQASEYYSMEVGGIHEAPMPN